jgi:hypothetical protein
MLQAFIATYKASIAKPPAYIARPKASSASFEAYPARIPEKILILQFQIKTKPP